MDTETTTENQDPSADATKMETNENEAQEGDKTTASPAQTAQPKQVVKAVDLQVDSKTNSFSQHQLQELTEREVTSFCYIIKFVLLIDPPKCNFAGKLPLS